MRAWLKRLAAQGVVVKTRHDWRGWSANGDLTFATDAGETINARADATVLALGGASWPKLGSTGTWSDILRRRGVAIAPFQPSNSGFTVAWSEMFRDRFEGEPLKGVELSFAGRKLKGEALVTRTGVEGGAIYALSAPLRDAIAAEGKASLQIDLRPDISEGQLAARLDRQRGGQSLANLLRKALALPPIAINLLRESFGERLSTEAVALARQIKHLNLTLLSPQPIERAISTAGGIALDAIDDDFMVKVLPNVYAVGEMLDWEAPTGGYLLQMCFATAIVAARAATRQLRTSLDPN